MRRLLLRFGLCASLLPGAAIAPPLHAQEPSVRLGGSGSSRFEVGDAVERALALRRLALTADARWGARLAFTAEVGYEPEARGELAVDVDDPEAGLTLRRRLAGAGGGFALSQAWGQLAVGPVGLRLGAVLPPVGRFNAAHDDVLWNLPRRPLVAAGARVLPVPAVWTEMGIGAVGEHDLGGGRALAWEGYLVNGVTLDLALEHELTTSAAGASGLVVRAVLAPAAGALDGSDGADAVTGRIAFRTGPAAELALSGYAGRYTPDFLDASARLSTVALDGRLALAGLVAEGEVVHTRWADVEGVATRFARVARERAAASAGPAAAELETRTRIDLEGLADSRSGLWLDLAWPIALPRGALGFDAPAVAPVMRYERVWLDRALDELTFSGGRIARLVQSDREQARVALGLALRPVAGAVVQLVYERSQAIVGALIEPVTSAGAADAVSLGLAVRF